MFVDIFFYTLIIDLLSAASEVSTFFFFLMCSELRFVVEVTRDQALFNT